MTTDDVKIHSVISKSITLEISTVYLDKHVINICKENYDKLRQKVVEYYTTKTILRSFQ